MDTRDIRAELARAGVRQWQVAELLRMSEAVLCRKLRPGTVPNELGRQIIGAINTLAGATTGTP